MKIYRGIQIENLNAHSQRPGGRRRGHGPGWGASILWAVFLLAVWTAELAAAEDPEGIRVGGIDVELVDGMLLISAESQGLFSRKSLSTLQSGLPAVVRLEIRLMMAAETRSLFSGEEDRYEKVHGIEVIQSIAYNVWDERYTVRRQGKAEVFADFPSAEQTVRRIERETLVSVDDLEPMRAYIVRARVQLVPISTEQGDRIADWLRHSHRLESEEEDSQFDINGLLSLFWARDEKSRNRSAWSSSRSFRIGVSGELIE